MSTLVPVAAQQEPQQTPPQNWQAGVTTKYVRVSTVDLPVKGHAYRPLLHTDAVIVDAEGSVMMSASNQQPLDLMQGNMQYLKAPTMIRLLNNGTTPARVVAIELLKDWKAPVKPCAPPEVCARDINTGGKKVGETATFFGNGYVTAEWNGMNAGGTLDGTDPASKGKEFLLFIPLTGMDATINGKPAKMNAGGVYATDAKSVVLSAGKNEARWCVLRINDKK